MKHILIIIFTLFISCSVFAQLGGWHKVYQPTITTMKPQKKHEGKANQLTGVQIVTETKTTDKTLGYDNTFRRTSIFNDTIIYYRHYLTTNLSYDTLYYTSLNEASKTIHLGKVSTDTHVYSDLLTISKQTRYIVNEKPPYFNYDSNLVIRDTILSRHQLKKIYDDAKTRYRGGFLYLAFNYIPSISSRSVIINDNLFTYNNELNSRNQREHANFGWAGSATIGVTIKKSHTIFAEGIVLQQGFKSDSNSIDWHTGLPSTISDTVYNYRFISNGFGIGYSYSPFKRIFNTAFESELYYTWLSDFKKNGMSQNKDQWISMGLKKHNMGIKIAYGLSIRPRYWVEFRVMPTLLYNFTDVNSGDLKTKLYNIGITSTCAFRLGLWVKN